MIIHPAKALSAAVIAALASGKLAAAGLDEGDGDPGILGKAVGEDAAGGAGADDDDVGISHARVGAAGRVVANCAPLR